MILAEVRDYLRERGQASLAEIASQFDASPQVVRDMLEVWVRKGKVQKGLATASCGSRCNQCDSATIEYYFWLQKPRMPVTTPGKCP